MKNDTTESGQTVSRLSALNFKRHIARPAPGAPPGALQISALAAETRICSYSYSGTEPVKERTLQASDIPALDVTACDTLWIDLQGLADTLAIEEIGLKFGLHPLVVADVVNVGQRPKIDVHEDYIVTILRQPRGGPPFESEQIAIICGKNFVLTFQERHGDIFDPIRQRMSIGSHRLQRLSAIYLAYALLDTIIDAYFPILEAYGDLTENLEQQVIDRSRPQLITDIHVLKRELLEIRRALWSQREAVNILLRYETELIPDELKIYLHDCADHSFQLLDIVEVYREIAQGLVDLHLSSLSHQMNEIMKVLTIIATIFIPITFITSLYGMNFDRTSPYNLPELGWAYGYFLALSLMAATVAGLLIYFRRKGWI